MDREAESLRRELDEEGRGAGRWYSPELRERVGAWARRRHGAGVAYEELGIEVGLARDTVRRWATESEKTTPAARHSTPRMLPVRVAVVEQQQRTVVVVSPAGFRIEGLTLAEAAAMLRALG